LIVVGLLLGVFLQAPVDLLQALSELIFSGFSPEEQAERARLFQIQGTLHAVMLFLSIALLVPLVEELMFRGALFAALCRDTLAIVAGFVTGMCFLISHTDYRLWPALALVAFVLSYLRVLAGSLWPCVALHAAFNATTLLSSMTGWASAEERLSLGWVLALLGSLLSAALLFGFRWIARRSPLAIRGRGVDGHV
jgi:membrane protease YdiL (CAAX protease family)